MLNIHFGTTTTNEDRKLIRFPFLALAGLNSWTHWVYGATNRGKIWFYSMFSPFLRLTLEFALTSKLKKCTDPNRSKILHYAKNKPFICLKLKFQVKFSKKNIVFVHSHLMISLSLYILMLQAISNHFIERWSFVKWMNELEWRKKRCVIFVQHLNFCTAR